jgi:predicted esterase YcpF (UPF0227 family)
MKKIVYLHGLEGSQGGPKVEFLSIHGFVYAPIMDYKTLDLDLFIETLGMPDLIIGSSMGGYVADIIGSELGVDVLLFNPALHGVTIEFNVTKNTSNSYNRTIILGTEDKIINPETTKKLSLVGHNLDKFEDIIGMGHRTPLNIFIDMYNKYS